MLATVAHYIVHVLFTGVHNSRGDIIVDICSTCIYNYRMPVFDIVEMYMFALRYFCSIIIASIIFYSKMGLGINAETMLRGIWRSISI